MDSFLKYRIIGSVAQTANHFMAATLFYRSPDALFVPEKTDKLLKRLHYLEDLEALRSLITRAETLRDGTTAESVDELLAYVTPDVRFVWSLEGIEVKGKEKLRENLLIPVKKRVWSRHVITNLQVDVKGDSAEATWYVMAEGVSRVEPMKGGDEQSKHTSPGNPDTIIHIDTKGEKWARLVRTKDGWKIKDYRTDMVRLTPQTLKVR